MTCRWSRSSLSRFGDSTRTGFVVDSGSTPTSHVSADLAAKILTIVAELVSELHGTPPERQVGPDDSLERDLGISSLERVELLVRLECAFGVRLGDTAMTEAVSPRDLAHAIASADPAAAWTLPARPTVTAGSLTTAAPISARTLTETLEWHAERAPEQVHIRLRQEDGEETPLTYGQLWTTSVDVANALASRGLNRRDTVAIMLRTEPAFFSSFFGTLLAGCIPVPMYPPFRADQIEEYVQRQVKILRNADARLMITFTEVERVAALLVGQAPSLGGVITHDILVADGASTPRHSVQHRRDNSEPALIQYTSGSTGHPKGVLLTHANLLANIRALEARLDVRADDVGVSWLPLYHDMGLIGAWLSLLYVGRPLVLMSPLTFLARPARWLQALHTHRGTLSAAPNFAYDLCTHRVGDDELEGLDLSAVRVLLNGAEAVQAESLDRFVKRFSVYGLRPEAIAPVYGLAECSLALTVPSVGRRPQIDMIDRESFQQTGEARTVTADASALRLPSCGSPLPGHEIRIVDRTGKSVPDRQEGLVQFRGPSATSGYYRNPEATRELVGPDGWLETGDLGYVANGELFLSGRRKDLIIKGGRNLQPQEVEEIVGSVGGVRKGCVAAFGIADDIRGTERFVIVAETRVTAREARTRLAAAIIEQVAIALGVPPDRVVLAVPGSVLKTSSGKIRRGATREAYLSGRLSRGRRSLALQWTLVVAQALAGYLSRTRKRSGQLAFTGWVLTLLSSTGPLVWLAVVLGPKGQWVNQLIGRWVRLLFALAGCPITTVGCQNIRGVKRGVYVANHASFLDPVLIMAALDAPVRFVAKARLATYPFLGTVLRKGGHILIDKNDLSQKIKGASAVLGPLKAGESLFVFPEGTFVAAPGLLPFRLGAFRAAVEAGCPMIPVAIRGTRSMFPAGTFLLRRGRITVTIGRPITPSGEEWPEIVRLRNEARAMIARESDEPG